MPRLQRHSADSETLLLPAAALAVFAMLWDWPKISALAAITVLLVTVWVHFGRPYLRARRLKHPCDAFFHIRELSKGELPWVIQDDNAHNLKEIVLPAHSLVEIEVSYYAKVPFHVEETVFECDGEYEEKPIVEEVLRPFVAKGEVPDTFNYWNRHGGFHFGTRFGGRAAGSCYTKGFKLRTKNPGTYKTWLGFITDELDGDAKDLVIRVEDRPLTRMKCRVHKGCWIRPGFVAH